MAFDLQGGFKKQCSPPIFPFICVYLHTGTFSHWNHILVSYAKVGATCPAPIQENVDICWEFPWKIKYLHKFHVGQIKKAARTQQAESMYSLHMETMTWLFTHCFNDIHFLLMATWKMWVPDAAPRAEEREQGRARVRIYPDTRM